MNKLFFWDTETSGLESSKHQILSFAGVYTDLNLNVIHKFETNVILRKDVVPSDYALNVNKLNPYSESFISSALTENQLLDLISENETKYNSILNYWLAYNQPFDLGMLSSTMKKNNKEIDLSHNHFVDPLKLAREMILDRLIITPEKVNKAGKPYFSSSLEDVSIACKTPHVGQSHSAMVDVMCMINTLKQMLIIKKTSIQDFLEDPKYRVNQPK